MPGSKKSVGRPKTTDPKIKLDNVRLKTSTILDIQAVSEKLKVYPSSLVQAILEAEMQKYKKILDL